MALKTVSLLLAFSLTLGIGGAQRNAVQNERFRGIQAPKPPVFKPLTPAEKAKIYSIEHVLPDPTATTRYYDVLHATDSYGALVFLSALEVSFGENFAELEIGQGCAISFFKPIAVRKKHLIIFTLSVDSSSTVSFQVGGEDNGWNAPSQNVKLRPGTNHISMVFQPKSNVPVKAVVQAGNTTFWFEKVTVELVKSKP